MARQRSYPSLEALRKLEASLHVHLCHRDAHAAATDDAQHAQHAQDAKAAEPEYQLHSASDASAPDAPSPASDCWISRRDAHGCCGLQTRLLLWWPRLRRLALVSGALGGLVLLVMTGLWWRLSSGPIELDIATPWLTAAIKENLGGGHEVELGGTQLESDANGRMSLRIRDIVVRDAEGTVVASAPKAEVGVSTADLFLGRIHAERLSLVGAEMAVRIEPDSRITVFAGTNKRPFVTASASSTPVITGATLSAMKRAAPIATVPPPPAAPPPSTVAAARVGVPEFAALIAWIESLGAGGLDGRDLAEIGLKGGNLTVDDQRNGKHWTFTNIDLSVTRPKGGGIAVTLGSEGSDRPWQMSAAMTPGAQGHRIIDIETQKVSAKDLMLAMRWGEGLYEPDLPLSARIRADVGPDGIPSMVDGRILVEKGTLIDLDDPLERIPIDRAEISLDWDATRQALVMPFQVLSGGNRITLLAQFDAPRESGGTWRLKVSGGAIVLASAAAIDPLILNRIQLQLRLDPAKQRIDVEQGELGNMDLGVALSGSVDLSGDDPRVKLGVAGTRMPIAAMKRLWPLCASPKVRAWVEEHVIAGTVERLDIATNAPWSTLRTSGPPIPEEGLSIEIAGHGGEIRPVEGLPAIRDADFAVRITGRTATINVGRGNVDVSTGRKLSITNGVFEVPDTFPKAPPARARFRLDGSVPAVAELLAMERLRDYASTPLDPATSRGTLTAQVALAFPLKEDLAPGSSTYAINIDVANFAADHMVMGQKVEANLLKVSANNQGHWIRGDVKLNGVPAALDYRKPRDGDADVRIQAILDEAARSKFGFDLSAFLTGPVPVKLAGRVPSLGGDSRLSVDADLTQAKIDNLLPGWTKIPGQPSRATFTLVSRSPTTRFEDLAIEAPNASVKGTVEVDSAGEVQTANFPVFSLSSGDKATLKADRGPDGTLRVTVRGDIYDGRGFVKSTMTGAASGKQKRDRDVDLDVKFGTVVGFHGETLRGLDLRVSRRKGAITSLALNGTLGRNTPLTGDVRGRGSNGRQVIFIETNDAGAFFRFNDIYPKIVGGQMWVALDPLSADEAPQEGMLNIRDFAVRGEAALDRVAGTPPPQQPGGQAPGVEFSRMRVEFIRTPGRFTIRDGLVKGPAVGATVDGYIDYNREEVHMRGTFVPLYGLNNMFGQIPFFGLFLGGSNEGLLGVTYEVVGPPSAPILRVNPISAVAPGLLRKFFEFPSGNGTAPQSYAEPARN